MKGAMIDTIDKGTIMLTDLLNWAYAISDDQTINLQNNKLHDVVENVFVQLKITCETKEISLINNVAPELSFEMDNNMMKIILRNLISNAIKFSHRGSKVEIESYRKDQNVLVLIKDQGQGMSVQTLDQIKNDIKLISAQGTEKEIGSGFGLGICRSLTEKQSGHLTLNSTLGKGTTVKLSFPLNNN
jgi:signal transduction histidine kinase